MLNISMAMVTKKNRPNTNAKYRSFFISETNIFSPNMYGTSSAVARRRIELTAKSMLRSCIVKGGSIIFTLLQFDTQ